MHDVVVGIGSLATLFLNRNRAPENSSVIITSAAFRSGEQKPFTSSTERLPVLGVPERWFIVALEIPEDAAEAILTVCGENSESPGHPVKLAAASIDLGTLRTAGRLKIPIDPASPEIKLVIVPRDLKSPLENQLLLNSMYNCFAFPQKNTIMREICGEVAFGYQIPGAFIKSRIRHLQKSIDDHADLLRRARINQGLFSDNVVATEMGYVLCMVRVIGIRNLQQNQRMPGSKTISSPFVVVSVKSQSGGSTSPVLKRVGRTNTEYRTVDPVFGTNTNAHLADHSKPQIHFEPGRYGRIEDDGQTMECYVKPGDSLQLMVLHERHSVYQGLTSQPMCSANLTFEALSTASNQVQEIKLDALDERDSVDMGTIFVVAMLKGRPSSNPFDFVVMEGAIAESENKVALEKIPCFWLSQLIKRMQSDMAILVEMATDIEARHLTEEKACFKSSSEKKKIPSGAITTNLHQCEFEICSTVAPFETRSRFAFTTCGVPAALSLGVKELSDSLFELRRKLRTVLPAEMQTSHLFSLAAAVHEPFFKKSEMGHEVPLSKCTALPSCSHPVLDIDDKCGNWIHRSGTSKNAAAAIAAATSRNSLRSAAASFASRLTSSAPTSGEYANASVTTKPQPLTKWQEACEVSARIILRETVAVSQSLAPTLSAFISEALLALARGVKDAHAWGTQLKMAGFLVGWESLISTHGSEMCMLADVMSVVDFLNERCTIVVSPSNLSTFEVDVTESSHTEQGIDLQIRFPLEWFAQIFDTEESQVVFPVVVVLFSQGVNEGQSISNYLNKEWASRQAEVNKLSITRLAKYALIFNKTLPLPVLRLSAIIENQREDEKEVDVLLMAEDAVRSLKGARQVMCKSGKDRTAMAVTLEQSRLGALSLQYDIRELANLMREFGVRIRIAEKNVGSRVYSFNVIQRMALPKDYRPPQTVIQDIATSYSKKDS